MNATNWIVGVVLVGTGLSPIVVSAASVKVINIRIEAASAVEVQKPLRRVMMPEKAQPPASKKGAATSRGFLEMPVVKNHREGSASYRFQVASPGYYWVWARVRYFNKDGNYFHVAVDGKRAKAIGFDSTFGVWHRVGGRLRVRCARGANTLVLSDVGAGVQVDQILLTTDHDYSYSGPISKRALQSRG